MSEPMKPMEIEQRSFEIITELLGNRVLDPENELVIKRVIHTTADFDYADNLTFSDHAVQKGIAALKGGCDIVTDTQMAKAGINKTILASLGGEVHCFMSDPDVAQEAKSRGVTRAFVSMEKAAALEKPCIFAIGNAPTALLSLEQLMEEGKAAPALIIGVPVGFVNVEMSKELIIEKARAPYIVARGRKGGSNVAAAICNALLFAMSTENFLLAFGRSAPVWCLGAVLGWVSIPVMNTNLDALLRSRIPLGMQGRVYSVRNTLQFFTIPLGSLLGGLLVDRVFEPLMAAQGSASLLAWLFGSGKGSGAAFLFCVLGVLGSATCLFFRHDRHLWALEAPSE